MALPEFSMRQLLEAGAHFGHQTHRWNPKMERYIFGSRSNIHIIDLSQTMPLLHQALVKVREVAASRRPGAVRRHQAPGLGAGRDRGQALRPVLRQPPLAGRHADQLAHHLGVDRAPARARRRAGEPGGSGRTKKELLKLTRERDKLELSLGGIKDMGGIPDLMFVIDTNKEAIAIQEARKLNIPVVAILDTNCDPDGITYPDPGQRRRRARAAALLRPGRRRGARRPDRGPGRPGRRHRRGRGAGRAGAARAPPRPAADASSRAGARARGRARTGRRRARVHRGRSRARDRRRRRRTSRSACERAARWKAELSPFAGLAAIDTAGDGRAH